MSAVAGATIVLLYMVEEDELVATVGRLVGCGFQVIPVGSLEEGKRALSDHEIGCAFVEVRSTHLEGLSAIADLRASRATAPIVVLSSNQDLPSRIAGRDAGADYYLATPVRSIDLEMTVGEIRKRLQGLFADSPGLAAIVPVPLPDPQEPKGNPSQDDQVLQLHTQLAQLRVELMEAKQSAAEAHRLASLAQMRLTITEEEAALSLREARSLADAQLGVDREVPSIAGGHPPEIDELTGLIGTGPLQDHLDREYARARRYGHKLSVLMLDVDGLGRYDKSYGAEAGDRALQLVADVLRAALRTPDIAARVGGDDFVILATDTSEEQAYLLAERLRAALRAEGQHASQPPVTVSIGIASSRRLDVKRAEDLLVAAQHAVHQAKGAGGDRSLIADH